MRIGIDLGGTKIEGIILANDGKVLAKQRINTPRGDYRDILRAIAGVVATLEKQAGRRHGTIGIGTPGALSPVSGLMRNSNSTELNGQPLKTDLESLLGREIRMVNDANCFALSEATDGAAKGANVVFGVILGTGVGAGIVVNGHVLTGVNAVAGEWGHNPLPWSREDDLPGFECYCGKKGCIETYLSGPGFIRDYNVLSGNTQTSEKIAKLAEQGDATAETAFRRYEDRLARALSHVINMLDPDVIVLGGGMSNIKRLYKNVPALWGEYVFSDVVRTQLVAPRYGDASGVRGAAWLWDGVADY
ncbi:MAG: ROK family protein [Gammaproteobacteria bacterium]|nr:ROK family protein [Gammaproteobacteria bacterium]